MAAKAAEEEKEEEDAWPRSWIAIPGDANAVAAAAATVTVMQFNVLADRYADFFPLVDPAHLRWEYRRPRIVQEILRVRPAVAALHEVDHFDDLREPLAAHGYAGLFCPKESGGDGTALFFRAAELALVRHRFDRYADAEGRPGKQIAVLAHFRCADRPLIVAATHLKASPQFEALRRLQAAQLVAWLRPFADEAASGAAVLILADMNTFPGGEVMAFLRDGAQNGAWAFESAYDRAPCESLAPPRLEPLRMEAAQQGCTLLETAASRPPFTTAKKRPPHAYVCATEDYILHAANGRARPLRVLALPSLDQLPPSWLPCARYPSDHLALACEFALE